MKRPRSAPGQHILTALFSGNEVDASSSASQTVSIAQSANGPLVGLSRYPVHNQRTLTSLFFNQALNPAEVLWRHNYKLHTSSGGNIKISHIYLDPTTSTVTLLPAHRLALRSTYNLKLLGLNSKSGSKSSSPTVASSGWLATNFTAKINHKALFGARCSSRDQVCERPTDFYARLTAERSGFADDYCFGRGVRNFQPRRPQPLSSSPHSDVGFALLRPVAHSLQGSL